MTKQTEWRRLLQKTYKEGKSKNASFTFGDAMKLASKSRKSMGRKHRGGGIKCNKDENGNLTEITTDNPAGSNVVDCEKDATGKFIEVKPAEGAEPAKTEDKTAEVKSDKGSDPAKPAEGAETAKTGDTAEGAKSVAPVAEPATGGRRRKRTKRGGNYSKRRSSRSRSKRSTYW